MRAACASFSGATYNSVGEGRWWRRESRHMQTLRGDTEQVFLNGYGLLCLITEESSVAVGQQQSFLIFAKFRLKNEVISLGISADSPESQRNVTGANPAVSQVDFKGEGSLHFSCL